MAEYIDRDVAKDELLSWAVCIKHPEHLMKEDAMHILDSIPAADVVEVVRCKDCKWQKRDIEVEGYWICNQRVVREDDFCSYGMRKEG